MITDKDYKRLLWANYGAHLFSTCSRRQYMSIIFDEMGRVSGTGYNGSPPGYGHCTDGFCPRNQEQNVDVNASNYDNCISIHSEVNAISYSDPARRHTLYVNGMPCYSCAKVVAGSGIKRVVYLLDGSRDRRGVDFLEANGIETRGMVI